MSAALGVPPARSHVLPAACAPAPAAWPLSGRPVLTTHTPALRTAVRHVDCEKRPGHAARVYVQAARMSLVGGALLSYRTTNQVAQLEWGT